MWSHSLWHSTPIPGPTWSGISRCKALTLPWRSEDGVMFVFASLPRTQWLAHEAHAWSLPHHPLLILLHLAPFTFGRCQVSVFGPLLLSIYSHSLGGSSLMAVKYHLYPDNFQISISNLDCSPELQIHIFYCPLANNFGVTLDHALTFYVLLANPVDAIKIYLELNSCPTIASIATTLSHSRKAQVLKRTCVALHDLALHFFFFSFFFF